MDSFFYIGGVSLGLLLTNMYRFYKRFFSSSIFVKICSFKKNMLKTKVTYFNRLDIFNLNYNLTNAEVAFPGQKRPRQSKTVIPIQD